MTQAAKSSGRDRSRLMGLAFFGQLYVGMALYGYDHVSTPGYLSILGAAAYSLVLCPLLPRWGGAGRTAHGLWAAVFLGDALLSFYALSALTRQLLPDLSPLFLALLIAALAAWAFHGKAQALAWVSTLLGGVILFLLLFSMATAFPKGNAGHLFPLLGTGWPRIGQGFLWLSGCGAGACCPLPRDGAPSARPGMLMLAGLLGAGCALFSAWLLPFYALSRPAALGWRLMLFSSVSASVSGWSMQVFALMLLLLTSLGAAATRSSALLARAVGKELPAAGPALLLLMVPICVLDTSLVRRFLLVAAPFRAAVPLAALALGGLQRAKRSWAKGDAAP